MADAFTEVDIRGMRPTHFRQLLEYIEHIEREDVYWGHKKQFKRRHYEIKVWLKRIVDKAYSEGTIIPKKGGF